MSKDMMCWCGSSSESSVSLYHATTLCQARRDNHHRTHVLFTVQTTIVTVNSTSPNVDAGAYCTRTQMECEHTCGHYASQTEPTDHGQLFVSAQIKPAIALVNKEGVVKTMFDGLNKEGGE